MIDLLRPWNHRNTPPLSDRELADVVRSGMTNGTPRQPHVVTRPAKVRPDEPSTKSAAADSRPQWPDPTPLRDAPRPPPFPIADAFPPALKPIRDYLIATAEAVQVPIDLPALLLLPIVTVCIARKVEVRSAPDHTEPAALYSLVLLKSGNRKSSTINRLTAPLGQWEYDEAERLGPVIARQQEARKIAEARLGELRKHAAKGEGEEAADGQREAEALAQQLAREKTDTTPQLTTTEPTPEALAALLERNDERLIVASAEADALDVMLGRYSKNGSANLGIYLAGHSGDPHRQERTGRSEPAGRLSICAIRRSRWP